MTIGELTPAARRLGRAIAGKSAAIEKRWQEFFADPSQWWDHRSDKVSPRYPDFKHKKTEAALWLDGNSNPMWVKAQLAAIPPGTIQSDIFSWNRRLTRHVEAGDYKKTLDNFHQMQQEGTAPDKSVFLRVLKACAGLRALDEGRRIHKQIVDCGYESDVYVGSSLVDMYTKCGSTEESWRVFNKMSTRTVVTWNTLLHGHVKCGFAHKALTLFRQMQLEGVEPDIVTFVVMLNACSAVGVGALEEGRRLHQRIIRSGCNLDTNNVGNSLIDMYAKCGSITESRKAFDDMSSARNIVSWNTMIVGYVKSGEGQKALELSQKMSSETLKPDLVTYRWLLNACASIESPEQGRRIHEDIIQRGFESDIVMASTLIEMYAKCGSAEEARRVFDKMPIQRNVMIWNAMILGYVKCREAQKALDLSQKMTTEGVKFDLVTFTGLLNACGSMAALEEGRRFHKRLIQSGYEAAEIVMGNSLIDMYAKCGSLESAVRIFDKMPLRSVVTWNNMIRGFVRCRQGWKAWELFHRMQREGVVPDVNTFVGVLNAVACVGTLENGKRIHKRIADEYGCEFDDVSVGNGLIDMYSKCGSILDARKMFNRMPVRNTVSWRMMLLGYANYGQAEKVLELSRRMREEGLNSDPVSFVAMLYACAITRALEEGKWVHEQMKETGCESEAFVVSSLVNMYAKCGSMADAWAVCNMTPIWSVATWNAMIMGCASNGEERQALDLFRQMGKNGVKPDAVTFMGLLKACGRLRVLEEGKKCHEQIIQNGFEFDIFLGNGLIDMYGRCGSIEEARKLFDKLPRKNIYTWNNMILEYARCGDEKSALGLSERLQREGDSESFWELLNISPDDGALQEGICVHEQMMQRGWESDILMGKTVVDMYGKGGNLGIPKEKH